MSRNYVIHFCKNKKCNNGWLGIDLTNAQSNPPRWKYCEDCCKKYGYVNPSLPPKKKLSEIKISAFSGTWTIIFLGPKEKNTYVVEYSIDQFTHVLPVQVSGNALDSLNLPQNTYQWRVRTEDISDDWTEGADITSPAAAVTPEVWQSDADMNTDLFFAQSANQWADGYVAQHLGSGAWDGTGEYAKLEGKNQITDVFIGSEDANILVLTDAENGDALFVDDIYSKLPVALSAQQARIMQIDEIRAGAGDDIVDMTSQRFEYIGGGVTIRGGLGDDTLWANKNQFAKE